MFIWICFSFVYKHNIWRTIQYFSVGVWCHMFWVILFIMSKHPFSRDCFVLSGNGLFSASYYTIYNIWINTIVTISTCSKTNYHTNTHAHNNCFSHKKYIKQCWPPKQLSRVRIDQHTSANSLGAFRKLLKSHLFDVAFPPD